MYSKSLLARRQQAMGPAYRLFYDQPVQIVKGEGAWLYDADDRRYLDMYNNVPHVGHCHPRIVDAICEQARKLNTHTRYLHENVVRLAERLTAKMPAALDTAMFCCTGSEANELALRIAHRATGGTGIIVVDYAYHGNTRAIYEISTDTIPASEIPPWVATVPAPDTYRGPHRDQDAAERYADCVGAAVGTLEARGIKPAAFIICPRLRQSTSRMVGQMPGSMTYLQTSQMPRVLSKAGMEYSAASRTPLFRFGMISPPGTKITDIPCFCRTSPIKGIILIFNPLKSSIFRIGLLAHIKFSMAIGEATRILTLNPASS